LQLVEAEPRIVINVNVTVALDKTPKPSAVVEYVRKLREELEAADPSTLRQAQDERPQDERARE